MSTAEPPRHVAIIMDGNGRWARARRRPRVEGHRAGVNATQSVVEACGEWGVSALTLFAFSSENWRRPPSEVSTLFHIFRSTLANESRRLLDNNVRVCFIGDRSAFPAGLVREMDRVERMTAELSGLRVNIAMNYGGRWDVTQAVRSVAGAVQRGELDPGDITQATVAERLALADLPEPDLLIRTGGEQRLSNYLLWQLAYTEFYFTDCLWPDFDRNALNAAIQFFQTRERRFGRTSEQARSLQHA